jgi:soluble lytic murein transglycosylase-like protein
MNYSGHQSLERMQLRRRRLMSRPSHLFALICFVCSSLLASAADFAVLHNGFSIRHQRREVIGSVTRLYLGQDKDGYVDVPSADIDHFEPDLSPPPFAQNSTGVPDAVANASGRYRLDPDLVNSVIRAESGFNVRAVSRKGARGLMQLMPATASQLRISDAFDPRANVDAGTRYLRELLERYNFDLIKALAAYNAGPQRVEQYRGVPPYYETQAYIARIVRDFNRQKLAEQKAGKKNAPVQRSQHTQKTPSQEASEQPASQHPSGP